MSATIERLATLVRRRLARDTEGEENLAIQSALAHRVITVIGKIDRVIAPHGYAVGALELALAPGTQKIAVRVEDDHRMRAARKAVHIIIFVDAYGGDFMKSPLIRKLAPAVDYFLAKFSTG